jgi:hypothetical protein
MAKEMDIGAQARRAIDHLREFGEGKDNDYGTATAVMREVTEALEESRTSGVDVSELRAQLPGLERKARRFYANKAVDRVRKIGAGKSSGYITPDAAIRDARNAINEARIAGAYVFDLESSMPEAEQKAWYFAAKKAKAGL